MRWNKIFEMGSPKTGTKSLGRAFEMLGLKHMGWNPHLHKKCLAGEYDDMIAVARRYDCFTDGPWHVKGMHVLFDREFPRSKFILLERDLESWLVSYERHFSAESSIVRAANPVVHYREKIEEIVAFHLDKYEQVKQYFKDRPDDLLVMNICAGEGWEKLCPFLELPAPGEPFPFLNKTENFMPQSPKKQSF